jgi:hypothetical protein
MTYKISDAVAMRMIQIFQEAVLFGLDGADLMRQVRLVPDTTEEGVMTLDPDYVKSVEEMHAKYLAEAESKKTETKTDGIVFS